MAQVGHHGPELAAEQPLWLVWPLPPGGERHLEKQLPYNAQGGGVLGAGEVREERLAEDGEVLPRRGIDDRRGSGSRQVFFFKVCRWWRRGRGGRCGRLRG